MFSVFGSVKFADLCIFLMFYTVAQLFKNLDCINYDVSLVVMELIVLPVLVAA